MAELPDADAEDESSQMSARVYAGVEVEHLEDEEDMSHYWLRYETQEGEDLSIFDLPSLLDDRLSLEVIHGGSHPGSPEGGIDLPTMSQELDDMEEAHVGTVTWDEEDIQDDPESYTFKPVESIEIEAVGPDF